MHSTSEKLDFEMVVKYCIAYEVKHILFFNTVKLLSNFSWEFEESEEDPVTSIPYQLQRLFVLLQTSKKRAIETTDVTRSFGWDSSEGEDCYTLLEDQVPLRLFTHTSRVFFLAWQQHDVQELCRVMFDALEQKWKQTEQVGESKFSNHSAGSPYSEQKIYCGKGEMGPRVSCF